MNIRQFKSDDDILINLQLFGDEEADYNDESEDDLEGAKEILQGFQDEEDFEEDEEEQEEENDEELESEDEDDDKEETGKPQKKKSEVAFTPEQQAIVDRIIQERLARERRMQEQRLAEEMARQQENQNQQAFNNWYQSELEKRANELVDIFGLEYEHAISMAKKDLDRDVREAQREAELNRLKAEIEESKLTAKQEFARQQYLKAREEGMKNPIIARYIKEIDEMSDQGLVVDFETACNYVLGDKLLKGDLLEVVKRNTEQKTIANQEKRRKAVIEKDSQPGSGNEKEPLTAEEKRMARLLGLTDAEYRAGKFNKKR